MESDLKRGLGNWSETSRKAFEANIDRQDLFEPPERFRRVEP